MDSGGCEAAADSGAWRIALSSRRFDAAVMTAATVSTDQGPVDGKPRPHPKKVPPASPRRRSLVRMDDSAVLAWFVGEITTDLRIHCSISVSGSPPTYNSTTLSRPCPSRDFILLPRGLTIVPRDFRFFSWWSGAKTVDLLITERCAAALAWCAPACPHESSTTPLGARAGMPPPSPPPPLPLALLWPLRYRASRSAAAIIAR